MTHRGTTNGNSRGSSYTRRERREWLVQTYRANVDVVFRTSWATYETTMYEVPLGEGQPACRCYRCGKLLTVDTVTVDRIKPGIKGGKYGTPRQDSREGRTNVRPACGGLGGCNESTGGHLGNAQKKAKAEAKPKRVTADA